MNKEVFAMKFSTIRKALILLAIMLVAAIPAAALAGSGTQADPYQVKTIDDLMAIANAPSAYYKQMNNIVVNDPDVFEFENGVIGSVKENATSVEWTPVDFSGNYDGGRNAITGLYVDSDNANGGLFGTLTNATISNLFIDFSLVESDEYAGLLAGKAEGTTKITGVIVSGSVIGKTTKTMNTVGGVVGMLGKDAVIDATVSYADVTGATSYSANVGGMVGLNNGKITASAFAGNVYGTTTYYDAAIGGIAGYNVGEVSNCRTGAFGKVSGESTALVNDCYVGGIAGFNKGVVKYNVNEAEVAAKNFSSGDSIVAAGGIVGTTIDSDVYECKNAGAVNGEYAYAGGIAGVAISDSGERYVEYCKNEGKISSMYGVAGGIVGRAVAAGEGYVSIILNVENCYNTGAVEGNATGEVAGETATVESAQVNIGAEVNAYGETCSAGKLVTIVADSEQYGSTVKSSTTVNIGALRASQVGNTERWIIRYNGRTVSGVTYFAPKPVLVTLINVADATKFEILDVNVNSLSYENGVLSGTVVVRVYSPNATAATAVAGVSIGNKYVTTAFGEVNTTSRIHNVTLEFNSVPVDATGAITVNALVVGSTDAMNPHCANVKVTK